MLPDANKKFLTDSAKTMFSRVEKQVKLFDDGDRIIPEVTANETSGHTPGHTSYMINIGGDKLFYTGDAIAEEASSINNPWFWLRFDFKMEDSVVRRVKLLDELAKSEVPALVYHVSFPGYDRTVKKDLAFDLEPVNWEFSQGVRTKCHS